MIHYTQHFSVLFRGDWPVYAVTASESGSYFRAIFFLVFTVGVLLQYRLNVKEMAILEVKDMKAHEHILSVNQSAPLTRLDSMGNVSMKTKLEYGWVVENIKHLMTGPKGNS